MSSDTAALARSITWAGSKQAYHTAHLVVDRDLVDDFYRAYAYFRWMDDRIDQDPLSAPQRIAFTARQGELIDQLYQGERPDNLQPEEEILADVIRNDRWEGSGLQSFIRNMFAIIEFDAQRKGHLVSLDQLRWYSERLSRSVTDGIQYFVGNGYPYPDSKDRYLAATAAHITHLLRDTVKDTADGFINIPREFVEAHDISPSEVRSSAFQEWVEARAALARDYFARGKEYLNGLKVLRCKLAGLWYCVRFEMVLDVIEKENYLLRPSYEERRNLSSWLQIAWTGSTVALGHVLQSLSRPRRERPQ